MATESKKRSRSPDAPGQEEKKQKKKKAKTETRRKPRKPACTSCSALVFSSCLMTQVSPVQEKRRCLDLFLISDLVQMVCDYDPDSFLFTELDKAEEAALVRISEKEAKKRSDHVVPLNVPKSAHFCFSQKKSAGEIQSTRSAETQSRGRRLFTHYSEILVSVSKNKRHVHMRVTHDPPVKTKKTHVFHFRCEHKVWSLHLVSNHTLFLLTAHGSVYAMDVFNLYRVGRGILYLIARLGALPKGVAHGPKEMWSEEVDSGRLDLNLLIRSSKKAPAYTARVPVDRNRLCEKMNVPPKKRQGQQVQDSCLCEE